MALSATLARLLAVVYPRADFLPHSLGVQFSTRAVPNSYEQTLSQQAATYRGVGTAGAALWGILLATAVVRHGPDSHP
jgi:hypothetical protein